MSDLYSFRVRTNSGEEARLSAYAGKVILIVNTASRCGFTPQYEALESLYKKYRDSGLEILAFPCNQFLKQEPGTNKDIAEFCSLTYGVSFPIFDKIDVRGKAIHPLYRYLTSQKKRAFGLKSVTWNFTKFLVNRDGRVVGRYAPSVKPENIEADIVRLLGEA